MMKENWERKLFYLLTPALMGDPFIRVGREPATRRLKPFPLARRPTTGEHSLTRWPNRRSSSTRCSRAERTGHFHRLRRRRLWIQSRDDLATDGSSALLPCYGAALKGPSIQPVREPSLRFGAEHPLLSVPHKAHLARVQRVVRQDQPPPLLWCQTVLDHGEVQILVTAIQFVAHDRVANVRQVNPYLVFAPRLWPHEQQGEG